MYIIKNKTNTYIGSNHKDGVYITPYLQEAYVFRRKSTAEHIVTLLVGERDVVLLSDCIV